MQMMCSALTGPEPHGTSAVGPMARGAIASPRPRVLFVCHSASRNGATILLLELLRWLRTQVDWEMDVLMYGTGPLLDSFRAVARTTVRRDPTVRLDALFGRSATGLRSFIAPRMRAFALPRRRYDLVYCNTSATAADVAQLAARNGALLWHIHELGHVLRLFLSNDGAPAALQAATRFVAVSQAVKDVLCSEYRIEPRQVAVAHGFVAADDLPMDEARQRRARLRAALDWPQDAFVVGACGSLGWRKGTDLFVQIAHAMTQAPDGERTRFLWVGGHPAEEEALRFSHDIDKLGLRDRCQLMHTTDHMADVYCAMDAFAITSREDPFPLVMLEAAAHALPVVCFDDAGGAGSFIGEDAGLAAPYLDTAAFARQLGRLRDDAALRLDLGSSGQRSVRTRYRVEVQGPLILDEMRACLRTARGRLPLPPPTAAPRFTPFKARRRE